MSMNKIVEILLIWRQTGRSLDNEMQQIVVISLMIEAKCRTVLNSVQAAIDKYLRKYFVWEFKVSSLESSYKPSAASEQALSDMKWCLLSFKASVEYNSSKDIRNDNDES